MTRIVLLALVLAACSNRALASEESQALSARASIALEAGRVSEGATLLDRAVAADPYDAMVRYQRAVLHAKQHQVDAAIEDLLAAVAYRPDFHEAELELGSALLEAGRAGEAVPYLIKAQSESTLQAPASFFLGVAQLRLNQLDDARRNFERARTLDPSLEVSTQYYLGVIDYRSGKLAAADTHFREVERVAPDSALAREAGRFRSVVHQGEAATYHAFGRVAFEYDSNVSLSPDTTVPGAISKEGDGRFVLNGGGSYVPWGNGVTQFSVGYEFFQSLHFDLSEFNLQDHRPSLQFSFERNGFSGGLLGRYDYYLLETDSFLSEVTAFPWLSYQEEGFGHTDVYYRMQRRDYKQLSFAVLEGFYHEAGARQFVELGSPRREFWCGYEFEFNDPVDMGSKLYEYQAHKLEAGLRWMLPYDVTGETGYRYTHQDYDSASAVFLPVGRRRRDHDHRAVVSLERQMSEINSHLFVTAAYFYTLNNSNKDDFEYDRHIGSVGVEVRL